MVHEVFGVPNREAKESEELVRLCSVVSILIRG
jgi:hypothetical protein